MILKYAPEGAEPRQWTFAPDRLMSSEAEAVEKVTAMTYDEFCMALIKGSRIARRALLWVLLKRTEPTLRHVQVDPQVGAIELEFEAHELRKMRDSIEANADLTDDERAAFLKQLDLEILAQIEDGEAEAPKAPESSGASSD